MNKAAIINPYEGFEEDLNRMELHNKFHVELYSSIKATREMILDLQDNKECNLVGNRNLELILEQLTVVLYYFNEDLLVYEIDESMFNDIVEEFELPYYKLGAALLYDKLKNYHDKIQHYIPKTALYTALVWCKEELTRLRKLE